MPIGEGEESPGQASSDAVSGITEVGENGSKMTTRHPVARRRRLLAGFMGILMVAALAAPAATLANHTINDSGTTLNGSSSVTVAPGATISLTVSVTLSNNDDWESTAWRLSPGNYGSYTCENTADWSNPNSTVSRTFDITAPAGTGTYNLYLRMWDNTQDCTDANWPYHLFAGEDASYSRSNAVVVKQAQTITFGALADKELGDADFAVSATASSGLTVAFSSTTTSVCTVSGSTVSLVDTGTCTIKADQAGNGTYAPAPSVSQSFEVTAHVVGSVIRIAGLDRYETAALISQKTFGSPVSVVYIATGQNYPDALAGGPAAAKNGGPVLLVTKDDIPASTAAELTRLAPGKIVVLGGPTTVSPSVEAALSSYSATVIRIAGLDRYETASMISADAFASGASVVYIATGQNYPDALAGGPAAAKDDGPVLLVTKDTIPASTADELTRLSPTNIYVLGGPTTVSPSVETALGTSGATVTRIAGLDRYETASMISAANFASGVSAVYIATGQNYPDALAGGPAAAKNGSPVLLVQTDAIPQSTADELHRLSPTNIFVLGGPTTVSTGVEGDLAAFLAP